MNIGLAALVWERAHRCCEYCRMPQIYDELPFEVDHVVAAQHGGKIIKARTSQELIRRPVGVRGFLILAGTSGTDISGGTALF